MIMRQWKQDSPQCRTSNALSARYAWQHSRCCVRNRGREIGMKQGKWYYQKHKTPYLSR